MNMVEKVARAIQSENQHIGIDWSFCKEEERNDCRRQARAAIEAMREPMPDLETGMKEYYIYTKMIDKALEG